MRSFILHRGEAMEDKKKNKDYLKGKNFFDGIKFWQKQIAGVEGLKSSLRRSKAESKEFPKKLHHQVEIRTAAERMIIKQLHEEIEQRKHLQEALQHSEIRFRRLFETAQDGILILSADTGQITEVNKFLIDMLGYSREEFLGRKLWEIGAFMDIDKSKAAFAELQDKEYVRYEDLPLKTKDDRLINVEFISNVYKAGHMKVIQCNIRDITDRKKLEDRLKILASHDELTGCINFRSIMELLEKEIDRSRRFQKQFSVIMIDIDDFKSKNDEYGHQVGNEVLVAFATVIRNALRGIDSVGRYGGEEFIVILPETDAPHALVALERIRDILDKTKIVSSQADNAKDIALKFSAGIAVFPHNARDLKELIWVADNALLQAKREGKNRAVLEKRKLIRLSPRPGTRIEVIDPSGQENVGSPQIADISKEGMLFLSSQDILGEDFLCRIYRPKDEVPFQLTCKVKHKGKSKDEFYRVGVYFPDISESDKEKLSECTESPIL
jgi:diguanylate cyclase (GGDEF)-like protein/PAS domain S-box-containing protein